MSVYGTIIFAFADEFVALEYFDLIPKVNAGYTKVNLGDDGEAIYIRGTFRNLSGKKIKNENGLLVETKGYTVWSEEDLVNGLFLREKESSDIYRIIGKKKYKALCDGFLYSLDKIIGDDGSEDMVEPNFNYGEGTIV